MDSKYLQEQIVGLNEQIAKARITIHQAEGAKALCEHLMMVMMDEMFEAAQKMTTPPACAGGEARPQPSIEEINRRLHCNKESPCPIL